MYVNKLWDKEMNEYERSDRGQWWDRRRCGGSWCRSCLYFYSHLQEKKCVYLCRHQMRRLLTGCKLRAGERGGNGWCIDREEPQQSTSWHPRSPCLMCWTGQWWNKLLSGAWWMMERLLIYRSETHVDLGSASRGRIRTMTRLNTG